MQYEFATCDHTGEEIDVSSMIELRRLYLVTSSHSLTIDFDGHIQSRDLYESNRESGFDYPLHILVHREEVENIEDIVYPPNLGEDQSYAYNYGENYYTISFEH